MTRKKAVGLTLLLLALVLAGLYFLLPRPVVRSPETTAITGILIECDPYYQDGPEDTFFWTPETEADRATEQEILHFLHQSKETRTLRWKIDQPPLHWRCMWIYLSDTRATTPRRERCVVIAPENVDWASFGRRTTNISQGSTGPGFLWRFNANLKDPAAIRTFVLEALDLPASYLAQGTETGEAPPA